MYQSHVIYLIMLRKYIWLLFFISAIYVIYSSRYYTHLEKYVKNYYESVQRLYNEDSDKLIEIEGEILFTPSALKKFNNLQDGLYLSILGQVFDVSNGVKHYGLGETYHIFTGRDASAAFITGDFTDNGLTDDVSGLTNKQIQSLMNWVEFYRKTYEYKGKLIGRYYNTDGTSTEERFRIEQKVQIAMKSDANEEQKKRKFPPCNVEWSVDIGTRVWCTKNSGGIARNWIGVPRMLFDDPESKEYRCACIRLDSKEYEENRGIIRSYEGCDENSTKCIIESSKG